MSYSRSRTLVNIALMHFSIQRFHNKNINDSILLWLFALHLHFYYLLKNIIYIPSFALKPKHALTKIRIKFKPSIFSKGKSRQMNQKPWKSTIGGHKVPEKLLSKLIQRKRNSFQHFEFVSSPTNSPLMLFLACLSPRMTNFIEQLKTYRYTWFRVNNSEGCFLWYGTATKKDLNNLPANEFNNNNNKKLYLLFMCLFNSEWKESCCFLLLFLNKWKKSIFYYLSSLSLSIFFLFSYVLPPYKDFFFSSA